MTLRQVFFMEWQKNKRNKNKCICKSKWDIDKQIKQKEEQDDENRKGPDRKLKLNQWTFPIDILIDSMLIKWGKGTSRKYTKEANTGIFVYWTKRV